MYIKHPVSAIVHPFVNTIADGDVEREIPYKALATDGTEITNYETIARSTNKLSLNASEGELKIVQNDNGTARIVWSDDSKYTADAAVNCYSQSGITNSIERRVLLTTIVAGGKNASPLMLSVKDMRRPDSIQTVDETGTSKTVVSGNGIGTNYGYDNGWGVKYYDQYGDILPAERVSKFFAQAETNDGVAGKHYGVLVERGSDANGIVSYYNGTDQSKVVLTDSKVYSIADNGDATEVPDAGSLSGYWPGKVNASERSQFTTKYSIVSKLANTEKKSDWTTTSKVVSNTYAVVPLSYMKSFEITDTAERYQLLTENTNNANGMGISDSIVATEAAVSADEAALSAGVISFKVKGTTKDNTVVDIPDIYFRSVDDSLASTFSVTASDIITNGTDIRAVSGGAINWNELYDENTARLTRIEASKTLRLLVCSDTEFANAGADVRQVITKTLKISDAGSAIQTFTFGANNKATNTNLGDIVKDLVVKDQYGMDIPSDVRSKITYTITDITENDLNNKDLGNYAHMANSFTVRGQSTSNVSLEGVEIGDKFKITGTIPGANVSYSVDVTVGSDTWAVLSSVSDNSKDDELRKTLGVRE